MKPLTHLSDNALLHELHVIATSHRRVTVELILHLGEVDARRLHVERGFSSLFGYCVKELRFSEDEACRRIEAARLARRFPAIYPLLQAGSVSLSVLGLLKPHLTVGNHEDLLAGVAGSSVRQAKEWLAARFPQPDVPSSIRKLPRRRPAPATPRFDSALATESLATPRFDSALATESPATPRIDSTLATEPPATPRIDGVAGRAHPTLGAKSARNGAAGLDVRAAAAAPATPAQARVSPLSSDRFLVKFTASRVLRDKLELARNLMSHTNPEGELALLIERAVDLLVTDLQKKKLGLASSPPTKPRPAKDSHVTRAVRREVVLRDGIRCSFVADDGRRCDAQAFLEFDHEDPRGRGGSSRAENLRILCRPHNHLAAERAYGKAHVARAIAASRSGATDDARRDAPTAAHGEGLREALPARPQRASGRALIVREPLAACAEVPRRPVHARPAARPSISGASRATALGTP